MSWDIEMKDESGDFVEVPHFEGGGTYPVGGTNKADLNVTYNYSKHFYSVMDGGIEGLDSMTGKDALPLLRKGVEQLGTETDSDYWAATPGNAGAVLSQLAGWAEANPEAIFEVC